MASLSNTGEANMAAFGQHGGVLASGDGAITIPSGKVVIAVTSLHADTQVGNCDSGFPQYGSTAIPVGVTVYGKWSTLTLAGGGSALAICYFGPKPGGTQTF